MLLFAAVAAAAWNTVANASFATGEAGHFLATVEEYEQAGEPVDQLLQAPMSLETGPDGTAVTDNPLRYDYERAAVALGTLSAVGGASSAIALSAVLFFPPLSMLLGVGLATHDVRSRSIRVRWPQSGLGAFLAAKVATLLLLLAMTCLAMLAAAAAAGAIAPLLVPEVAHAADITPASTVVDAKLLLAAVYAPAIGVLFGLVAFAISSWTRERAFTMTAMVLVYFLVPILGPLDPRNLILIVGNDILAFSGSFHPVALAGPGPLLSATLLGLLVVAAVGAAAAAWSRRAKF